MLSFFPAALVLMLFTGTPAWTQDEGTYWKPVEVPDTETWPLYVPEEGRIIIFEMPETFLWSKDLLTWQEGSNPDPSCIQHNIYHAAGYFWDLCYASDYRTDIYRSTDMRNWQAPYPTQQVPVRFLIELDPETILLAGDAGVLIRIDRDGYEPLHTPSNQHIRIVHQQDHFIYAGFRRDGMWKLDTRDFSWEALPAPDTESTDILMIGELGSSGLFAASAHGRWYRWNGEYFDDYPLDIAVEIQHPRVMPLFDGKVFVNGKDKLWFFDGNSQYKKALPTREETFPVMKGPHGNPVIQDHDGRIWSLETDLFFGLIEAPTLLDISFMPSAQNMRYIRAPITAPDSPEHIFWDTQNTNQIRFFAYNPKSLLLDITSRLMAEPMPRIDHLFAFDFTNNKRADLLSVQKRPDETFFQHYHMVFERLRTTREWSISAEKFDRFGHASAHDMNGNGKMDLLLSFYFSQGMGQGKVIWLKNRFKGRFHPERAQMVPYTAGYNTVFSIADCNNDGKSDMILGNYWRRDLVIYDFAGTPDSTRIFYFPERSNTTHLLTADFNGNGYPDILRVTMENGLELWLNNYPDHGFSPLHDQVIGSYPHHSIRSVSATDLNGNGFPDIILSLEEKKTGRNPVLLNNGNGFTDVWEPIFKQPLSSATWVPWDYNGNGRQDLMLLHPFNISILENVGLSPSGSGEIYTDGSTQIIYHPGIQASFLSAWHNMLTHFFYVIRQSWFYHYIIMILVSYAVIFYGLLSGSRVYDWNNHLTGMLFMANSVLFWLILFLSTESPGVFPYLIPSIAAVTGTILPLFVSFNIRQFSQRFDRQKVEEELVDVLLRFSHGEWANSLINRFVLLLKNYSHDAPETLIKQISERAEHFNKTILPEVERMILLSRQIRLDQHLLNDLSATLDYFRETPTSALLKDSHTSIRNLEKLQSDIRRLRSVCWTPLSSDLIGGIQEISTVFEKRMRDKAITLERERLSEGPFLALIPFPTLIQVLDNLLNNAIKAVDDRPEPAITIRLYRNPPKLYIEVEDNGKGLDPALTDRIFETGFSEFGSSGIGLATARKELSKYGARISFTSNGLQQGAKVILEFLEGTV